MSESLQRHELAGTQLALHTAYPVNVAVSALLYWALTSPDQPALVADDGCFPFAQLRDRMLAIAAELRRRGAGPGTIVELATGHSRDTAAGYLACWLLGAGAVPIDPDAPPLRRDFIRADSGVELSIDSTLLGRLIDPTPAQHSELLRQPAPRPEDEPVLAYLIYTSGTTGEPKGVEVSRDNLNCLCAALVSLELAPGGTGINPVSPAYDGWLWCFLPYLMSGQCMHVLNLAGPSQVRGATEAITSVEPSTVCVTPTILRGLDESALNADVLVVAGEVCTPDLIERFSPGRRMLNVYGPTEATIAATWADSARGDDLSTIGRPIPGYRAAILDPAGQPVAIGAVGELYLRGPGVALGYRNRPELTAARFLPDSIEPGTGRMYRTGDFVRQRPDGQLEFHAREDTQVKLRGFRVELAEIEAVALRRKDIRAAACYVRQDQVSLGLAVVGARDPEPDLAALTAELAGSLPAHLRPATVHPVERIALLPTGKIDRSALAMMATDQPDRTADEAAPPETSPTEAAIRQIWQEPSAPCWSHAPGGAHEPARAGTDALAPSTVAGSGAGGLPAGRFGGALLRGAATCAG